MSLPQYVLWDEGQPCGWYSDKRAVVDILHWNIDEYGADSINSLDVSFTTDESMFGGGHWSATEFLQEPVS